MTALTLLFLRKYLSAETERRLSEAEPEQRAVVVFSRTVSKGQPLTPQLLALREFPSHLVGSQWLNQAQVSALLGRKLRYQVPAGEPLTTAMLASRRAGGLTEKLPANHYAVTLASQSVNRHNGLLKPGDNVDIAFYGYDQTGQRQQHVFTDLTIFDLGGGVRTPSSVASQGITVLVTAKEIARFSALKSDEYAIYVRPTELSVNQQRWRAMKQPSAIVSWE